MKALDREAESSSDVARLLRQGAAELETPNQFISDGSQFTTGAAENPTLTVVALAIRQADHPAQQLGEARL